LKLIIFIITLFCFENLLFAMECSLDGLNQDQKGEVNRTIKERLDVGFKKFFEEKKIELVQSEISFNLINVSDPNYSEDMIYSVDLSFTGKTNRSILSNKLVGKDPRENGYLGKAYVLNFSLEEVRNSEGIPIKKYCQIWAWSREIRVFNNSNENYLIGSFYLPEGNIAVYEARF
jgi:hypothetical protein